MKTTRHIIFTLIALLLPAMASANVFENRVKQALENITQKANISNIGLTYSINTDPETGNKDGELRIVKFKLGSRDIYLIDEAVAVYQQINDDSRDGEVPYLYTLWFNSDNKDRTYSGINLYYSHENSILVGTEADNCYTVGFYLSENTDYRHTYTLEWNDTEGDSLKGRIITTFGPIKGKATSDGSKLIPFSYNGSKFLENLQTDMEKYQKGMEKYQAAIEKAEGTSVVTGKVTDEKGEPLVGALVLPVGGGYGTTTDINGDFSLNIHNHVTQLQVSYVGYKTQTLPVEPNMVIKMKPGKSDNNELSDLFFRVPNTDLFLRVPDRNKSLTPSKPNSQDWMKKLLFYVEKVQQPGDRYLYLSKLYDLCKDTEGLDQTDLKIGMKQLASVYHQLKEKKKLKENELLFLESMVDLLESKIH